MLLADRIHKFMFDNGILTDANAAKLFSDNLAEVDQAIVAESARWGDNRRPAIRTPATIEYHRGNEPLAGQHLRPE